METELSVINGLAFLHRPQTGDLDVIKEVIEGDNYCLKDIPLTGPLRVIDVGAHIGSFSRHVESIWPGSKYWAYEANPRNWELLKQNTACLDIQVFEGACVGTEPENKRMIMDKRYVDVTGGWGINWGPAKPLNACDTFEPITNFYSLHDVLKDTDIDILKIDCEGSEWNILYYLPYEDLKRVKYFLGEFHPGALLHCKLPYDLIRHKILSVFDCPALEERTSYDPSELYNVFGVRR